MTSQSTLERLVSVCKSALFPSIYIIRGIRSPNPRHILRTILAVVQNIKRQIQFLAVFATALCLSSDQIGLKEFTDKEQSSKEKGIIYARVSSNEQATEGHSLNEQVESLTTVANNRDIELVHEPIKDEGETGTNFDRDGIQQVFQLAKRDDVSYLLCQNVDRIGRSAAETLYFLRVLQTECEVKLRTTSGEQDLDKIEGLMHTTLMSLLSEVSNEIRTSKAKNTQIRRFVEEKRWHTIYPTIPFGYQQAADGWLEVDPENEEIVEEIFTEFLDCEAYETTGRRIENRHGPVLEGHRVKTLLQQEAYIGKPQIPEEWNTNEDVQGVVEDSDLKIIDEKTFKRAQRVIAKKDQIHSTDEESNTIVDFIEEFDLFTVIQSSEPAKLHCECGCEMVKNGQRNLKGEIKVHRCTCPGCGKDRKWPRENEYDRMELVYDLLNEGSEFLKSLK